MDNGPAAATGNMANSSGALRIGGNSIWGEYFAGRIDDVRLVMELTPDELSTVLTDRGPTNDELSLRAEHRRAMSTLTAPTTLGTPEPEPPPGTLPRPLETLIATVQCVLNLLDKQPARHGLAGTGVGTRTYTGPVRIARSPEEAVNNVEIGDVPVSGPDGEVLWATSAAIVRQMPSMRLQLTLASAGASPTELGRYVLEHSASTPPA